MMFKLFKMLVILAIIMGVVVATKDMAAKFVVQKVIKATMDLELKIKDCRVVLSHASIDLKGVELMNPRGFPTGVMLEIPEVYLNLHLKSLLKLKIRFEEIRLALNQILVIKNKSGQMNVQSVSPKTTSSQGTASDTSAQKESSSLDMEIDRLTLKVGKVIYTDYSQGEEPVIKEYKINIRQTVKDIKSTKQLVSVLVQQVLLQTAVENAFDAGGQALNQTITESVQKSLGAKAAGMMKKMNFSFGSK